MINIIFATAEPKNANKLVKSIYKNLPQQKITIGVLIIGKLTIKDNVSFSHPVDIIAIHQQFIPIVESRNICQKYLYQKMCKQGGIGFILDDDKYWEMSEKKFLELIKKLKYLKCDMAFSSLHGDPPIPKEYTRAAPLLDILFSIDKTELPLEKIKNFLLSFKFTTENTSYPNDHHDYYAFNKNNFFAYFMPVNSINWEEFIIKLYKGKKTTRSALFVEDIEPAIGHNRGGATIILNHLVLKYQNKAMKTGEWISRRSDMMMASAVKNAGYKLYLTPPIFSHDRNESFDSHNPNKLIGDIIGVALVNAYFSKENTAYNFSKSLENRLDKTIFIIKQTTMMLALLETFLTDKSIINNTISTIINKMIIENKSTLEEIKKIDILSISQDYNKYKKIGLFT